MSSHSFRYYTSILGWLWVGVLISIIDSHYYWICLALLACDICSTDISISKITILLLYHCGSSRYQYLPILSYQSYLLYLYLAGTCNLNIQDINITNLKNFPSLVLVWYGIQWFNMVLRFHIFYINISLWCVSIAGFLIHVLALQSFWFLQINTHSISL